MYAQLYRNKWRLFAIIALISLAIPVLVVTFVLITTDQESVVFFEHYNPVLSILIILYYALIVALGVVWLIRQLLALFALKNEAAKNELQHLQSQVNPHFFFNVLNQLYGLVGKDAQKAQQLIIQLSDLMRYSIYDGQREVVTIGEEVAYLKNYVALHQMRYHKKIDIQFEIDLPDESFRIMPLLFIVLAENAFKHGVEQLRNDAFVHMKLKADKESLDFAVINNFDPEETHKPAGVGLKNLKRRLKLMYPKKHTLSLSQAAGIYTASLTLPAL